VKKEDLLKEASENYAKLGDWEKFCELNVELGNWDKALIAAPHVSIEYWKQLTLKYSEFCNKNNKQEKIFASVLSNNSALAYKNFIECGHYEDAKLYWLTRECNPNLNQSTSSSKQGFELNPDIAKEIDSKLASLSKSSEIAKVTYLIARDYLTKGFPILSAASYLSIKDYNNTLRTLIM
jgi:hypothetical protein